MNSLLLIPYGMDGKHMAWLTWLSWVNVRGLPAGQPVCVQSRRAESPGGRRQQAELRGGPNLQGCPPRYWQSGQSLLCFCVCLVCLRALKALECISNWIIWIVPNISSSGYFGFCLSSSDASAQLPLCLPNKYDKMLSYCEVVLTCNSGT